MHHISQTINTPVQRTQKHIRCERDEVLEELLDMVNPERIKAGYQRVSQARMSMLLAKMKLDTDSKRYAFLNECRKAKYPVKYFNFKAFNKQ